MTRLQSSRIGRAWFAIRADETSAQTSGVAINRYKMLAFAISALIAGLGGSMMGFQYHVISTNTFDFWLSVIVLCCIVLGGMGSIRGVLIGTVVLMGLGEVLRDVLPKIGVDQRARMLASRSRGVVEWSRSFAARRAPSALRTREATSAGETKPEG